ncbi:MAG: hypothetical protein Q4A43_05355 [Coriobacteriia bacterium]|nr:hypothetical protein [Coriobacteriia bacterium]
MAAPALANAAAPARRKYSSPAANPSRTERRTAKPSGARVRVVRGGKSQSHGIDLRSLAKPIIALILVFAIASIAKITIVGFSYNTAQQTSELRTQISDLESETTSLTIQKSLVASPTNLRDKAEKLGMSAAESSETIKLSKDVVKTDAAGNLSLSLSLAAVAKE